MIAWAPGTALGPYELIGRLGAGGMGEVWKARDTRVDRLVAIKRLNAEHAERFKREARAIAALNHPHICQLYDVGPDYLVMEYIDGPILTGPMPVPDAQRLASQIAEALAAAHRKGIVHRDLKPANIMVSESGAKLLDFGLALIDGPASVDATMSIALSRPGAVVGTVAYMSPEQAQGHTVDVRSDVFSFGAVLYEMLSGRRAFGRDTLIASLSAVVNDVPAPLDAPATLERIVSRCLAKHPRDRFQSMTEVLSALEQTLNRSSSQHPSIAVLPFANMSRDPDDEYFSDGLAEEIINLLAKVPNLKVTARTSSFAFRGKEQDIRQIGDALGVRTILEGSVRRAGSRIRVTAQLINTEDGYHLWSERYDRELTDVFAIQDDIAEAIAGALKTTLVARPAKHTPSVPAYEALLKARQLLRTYVPEAHARALEYCQQAIALDPQYAAAYALLAFVNLHSTTHIGRRMTAVAPEIRRAAARALELDPLETQPHFLLGAVAFAHDYNWSEAEREFEIALGSPSAPAEAHWSRACFLSTFARFEESTAEMRRAVELRSADPPVARHSRRSPRVRREVRRSARRGPQRADKERSSSALGNRGSVSGAGKTRRRPRGSRAGASQPPAAFDGCRILRSDSRPRRREGSRCRHHSRDGRRPDSHLGPRVVPLAVLRDRRSGTLVPGNDFGARAVRSGLRQLPVYRGAPGQPALAESGRDDEPHSNLSEGLCRSEADPLSATAASRL